MGAENEDATGVDLANMAAAQTLGRHTTGVAVTPVHPTPAVSPQGSDKLVTHLMTLE